MTVKREQSEATLTQQSPPLKFPNTFLNAQNILPPKSSPGWGNANDCYREFPIVEEGKIGNVEKMDKVSSIQYVAVSLK